jgi:ABC-2 type transport system ATP-binding protein
MAPVEFRDLSKRFAGVAAVKDLSFDIEAGRVTGFLGPNGAGKSTTLRALLGLVRPSSGSATFDGKRYAELAQPAARVGAVLEDASFHPGRSARNHLRILAATGGLDPRRVDEVLAAVGLGAAADRRVKGFSMGMRQRLAIAAALLGDPQVLILDEPTNGLDPPGITWLRGLLREQAAGGRAVLVSSHVLAEVAQSVDDVVVIAEGQLRAQGTLEHVLGGTDGPATEVRAHDPGRLSDALKRCGHRVERDGDVLHVLGATPAEVGEIAGQERVAVLGLAPRVRSLEEAFLTLTGARA